MILYILLSCDKMIESASMIMPFFMNLNAIYLCIHDMNGIDRWQHTHRHNIREKRQLQSGNHWVRRDPYLWQALLPLPSLLPQSSPQPLPLPHPLQLFPHLRSKRSSKCKQTASDQFSVVLLRKQFLILFFLNAVESGTEQNTSVCMCLHHQDFEVISILANWYDNVT